MKKLTLIVTVIATSLLFWGCSKDDHDPNKQSEYYFRFKVDGIQTTYPFTPETQINLTGHYGYDQSTETYNVQIAGIRNIFEHGINTLTIFISKTEEVSTNVSYSNIPAQGDATPDFIFSMGYFNGQGNIYLASLNTVVQLYETAIVEFSEITDSYINGTFSGTLIWYDSSGGVTIHVDSVVVSEGEFKVPRY